MPGHATELIKKISIVLMTHILNPLSLVIETKIEFVNLKNGTVSVRRLNRSLAQISIISKINVQRKVYILSVDLTSPKNSIGFDLRMYWILVSENEELDLAPMQFHFKKS